MNDSVENDSTQTETLITANTEAGVTTPIIQVVPNWRKVLFTWSFWTMVASVILSFIEQVLPFFGLLEPTMSATAYGLTLFSLNSSAILFRMIKQKNLWNYPVEKPDENTLKDTPNDS